MPSPYRALDVVRLRQDLLELDFTPAPGASEVFGVWCEFFAVRWDDAGVRPAPLARRELVDLTSAAAERAGVRFGLGARPACPAPDASAGGSSAASCGANSRGVVGVGHGHKVWLATPLLLTPAECHDVFERALIALRAAFGAARLELVDLGADPWRSVDDCEAPDAPGDLERERQFARSTGPGLAALRLTARQSVVLGWGSAVQAPLRWKAAQLSAPFVNALFAHSPVVGGVHPGARSFASRAWRLAAPEFTAPPPTFADAPDGDRVAQYLTFALEAGVVAHESRLSFGRWLEHGVAGQFPELADWRRHLATLLPPVRPSGVLELVCADAQPRAFSLAPLTLLAALLGDGSSLPRVLDRFGLRSRELARRYELAESDGLVEASFLADAKALVAIAADSVLRTPSAWFGASLRVAFVHFAERCALRGRTPADELLDAFLRRGDLDRAALYEHEHRLLQPVALARAS